VVNSDRVKRKLPSLLIDGETTDKRNWTTHNRLVYRLQQFKKRNPQRYSFLANRLLTVLEEIEKAVSAN